MRTGVARRRNPNHTLPLRNIQPVDDALHVVADRFRKARGEQHDGFRIVQPEDVRDRLADVVFSPVHRRPIVEHRGRDVQHALEMPRDLHPLKTRAS